MEGFSGFKHEGSFLFAVNVFALMVHNATEDDRVDATVSIPDDVDEFVLSKFEFRVGVDGLLSGVKW